MPRLVLPLAIATLLLAVVAPAQAQGLPDPLGLRGFNLGMTLADVRKLPHPDAEHQKSDVKIGLTCTGEPAATVIGLPPARALDGAHVSYCGFYAEDKDGIRGMPMNVGGHDAQVVFKFTPEKLPTTTAARLYKIIVLANPANFDSIADAYQSKFGKAKTAAMPVKSGSKPSRMMAWEGDRYQLLAAERMNMKGHTGGRTTIMYTYLTLEKVVEGMEKRKTGADKL